MLVDSHCHIDFPELADDLPNVLARMQQNGVTSALCVGVTIEHLPRLLAIADAHPSIFASVGVHPDNAADPEPSLDDLLRLAAHPKVVAIGETGLDYHWHKDRPEWQRQRFRTHIAAARQSVKPLIIHTREAAADTLQIMREAGADRVGGVMHCFTEDWETASAALDLGFYISFSGIVTFKNAVALKEVAKRVPLDRLLLETDSPYLAPVPFRGKLNQPAYVRYVAEEVARLREMPLEELAAASSDNFFRLFSCALRP
ncbi:TatD family hydrolase [Rhodocyclus tenuis]|uniref:TatD family hydrolase n=1 Tax=Rhodocyclus gracilis TaxID=2929842 RepID=A0ABX0WFE1_9RHOO|nr:TatD family hydrolase [Rhodocyclus gracilis]NJA87616.1 TatD family hydrolase [Rhodocyclus gracilis]